MSDTKRPQNRCGYCRVTWYPRGSNLSRKCPECGSDNVQLAQPRLVEPWPVAPPTTFGLAHVIAGACLLAGGFFVLLIAVAVWQVGSSRPDGASRSSPSEAMPAEAKTDGEAKGGASDETAAIEATALVGKHKPYWGKTVRVRGPAAILDAGEFVVVGLQAGNVEHGVCVFEKKEAAGLNLVPSTDGTFYDVLVEGELRESPFKGGIFYMEGRKVLNATRRPDLPRLALPELAGKAAQVPRLTAAEVHEQFASLAGKLVTVVGTAELGPSTFDDSSPNFLFLSDAGKPLGHCAPLQGKSAVDLPKHMGRRFKVTIRGVVGRAPAPNRNNEFVLSNADLLKAEIVTTEEARPAPPDKPKGRPVAKAYRPVDAWRLGSGLKGERVRFDSQAEIRARPGRLLLTFSDAKAERRLAVVEVGEAEAGEMKGAKEGEVWDVVVEATVVGSGAGGLTLTEGKVLKALRVSPDD